MDQNSCLFAFLKYLVYPVLLGSGYYDLGIFNHVLGSKGIFA